MATAAGNIREQIKLFLFQIDSLLIKFDSVLATAVSEATAAGKNNLNHLKFNHNIKAKFFLDWAVATAEGNIREQIKLILFQINSLLIKFDSVLATAVSEATAAGKND